MLQISLDDIGYETLPEESLLELSLEIQEANESLYKEEIKHELLCGVVDGLRNIDSNNIQVAREQLRATLSYIGQEHLTNTTIANEGIGNLISKASKGFIDIIKTIWDKIVDIIKKIYNWIKKAIKKIFGKDDEGGSGGGGSSYSEDTAKETNKAREETKKEEEAKYEKVKKDIDIDAEIREELNEIQKSQEEKKLRENRKKLINQYVETYIAKIPTMGINLIMATVSPDYIGPNNYSILKSFYGLKEGIDDDSVLDNAAYDSIFKKTLKPFFFIQNKEAKNYRLISINIAKVVKFVQSMFKIEIGKDELDKSNTLTKKEILEALMTSGHLSVRLVYNDKASIDDVFMYEEETLMNEFKSKITTELQNAKFSSSPDYNEVEQFCKRIMFDILAQKNKLKDFINTNGYSTASFVKDSNLFIDNLIINSENENTVTYISKVSGKAIDLRLKDLKSEMDRIEKEKTSLTRRLKDIQRAIIINMHEVDDMLFTNNNLAGKIVFIRCDLNGESVRECLNKSKLGALLKIQRYAEELIDSDFILYPISNDSGGGLQDKKYYHIDMDKNGKDYEIKEDGLYEDEYKEAMENVDTMIDEKVEIETRINSLTDDLKELKAIFTAYANAIKVIISNDNKKGGNKELDNKTLGELVNEIELDSDLIDKFKN